MERLQSVDWVVQQLDLRSRARAYDLARRKIIPSVKVGRLTKFDPAAIAAFKRSGGQALRREAENGDAAS